MKNLRTGFVIFCGFIYLGIPALPAQESSPVEYPPPTAPFVAPVPEKAQWTITLDYGGSTPTNSGATPPASKTAGSISPPSLGSDPLMEIRSIRTGRLKQDILVYKDGKPLEYWYVGNLVLAPGGGGGVVAFTSAMLTPTVTPGNPLGGIILERGNLAQSAGFPGLNWVKFQYYDKVVLLGTVPCYHYIFPVKGAAFAEAWITVQGKLPAQYAGSGVLYTVAFGPAPTSDLTLPPAFAQAASASEKFMSHARDLEAAVGH